VGRWTWHPVGPPLGSLIGGCWLGVFACALNSSFADKGCIAAAFDHLNFGPLRSLQIGRLGVPPSAGAVPPIWQSGS
jgi:hypothetical protein